MNRKPKLWIPGPRKNCPVARTVWSNIWVNVASLGLEKSAEKTMKKPGLMRSNELVWNQLNQLRIRNVAITAWGSLVRSALTSWNSVWLLGRKKPTFQSSEVRWIAALRMPSSEWTDPESWFIVAGWCSWCLNHFKPKKSAHEMMMGMLEWPFLVGTSSWYSFGGRIARHWKVS